MTKTFKQRTLLLIGLAGLVMALLAFSLPALQMQPGVFVFFRPSDQPSVVGEVMANPDWLISLVRGAVAIALVLLPVYILVNLFSRAGRRRLLKVIGWLLLLFLLATWLSNLHLHPRAQDQAATAPAATAAPPGGLGTDLQPLSFVAHPQPWMLGLISVCVGGLVALAAYLLLRCLSTRKAPERSPLQDLAAGAQAALDDLEMGADFADVVVRCYAQMSQTLRKERGLQRAPAMTPGEFEQALLAKGFPPRPIQQLTRLFEQVRYGRQPASDREKRTATESLYEIVAFCQGQA